MEGNHNLASNVCAGCKGEECGMCGGDIEIGELAGADFGQFLCLESISLRRRCRDSQCAANQTHDLSRRLQISAWH